MIDRTNTLENGFLFILLILASVGLLWLFGPFLSALFFALLLATSTYGLYQWLLRQHQAQGWRRLWQPDSAAFVATTVITLFVVVPLLLLLIQSSIRFASVIGQVDAWVAAQSIADLDDLKHMAVVWLPLDEATITALLQQIEANLTTILTEAQAIALGLMSTILNSTFGILTFITITLFTLYFFYRDGESIGYRLKVLSPLPNHLDQLMINRFTRLSTLLTISVVAIALLQGLAFAIASAFFGLPWLFLGLLIALTSFIPVVGTALVWVPLVLYLLAIGDTTGAVTLLIVGAVINAIIIDNMVRPWLLVFLSRYFPDDPLHPSDIMGHTLLTVLATLAGIIQFGIMGLFYGPMIAAMAITVFDVYAIYHQDRLDMS